MLKPVVTLAITTSVRVGQVNDLINSLPHGVAFSVTASGFDAGWQDVSISIDAADLDSVQSVLASFSEKING